MVLHTEIIAVLHDRFRVICQSSHSLLVASLYVEDIEAVKSRAALSASSSELVWILGEINSESKR
jgi:hypothetical protein